MEAFEELFGIPQKDVQRCCVLLPFLKKSILASLEVSPLQKAFPYGAAQGNGFTLIYTGMGAPFLGDAVLRLADTPAASLMMIGACGSVRGQSRELDMGSVVTPVTAYAAESFTDILTQRRTDLAAFAPDSSLLERLQSDGDASPRAVRCMTFGSYLLEADSTPLFREYNIDVVDMECSAFLAAARHIQRPAVAVFCITDILHQKPLFRRLEPQEQGLVDAGFQRIAGMVHRLSRSAD